VVWDVRRLEVASIITGVVIGALVALAGAVWNYYMTKWRDQDHWQREDELRYQEQRLAAYTRFLRTTETVVQFKANL